MDFKFLNDRYMKGKEEVTQYLNDHHQLLHHENLALGHASVVAMQAAMGPSGCLNSKHTHFVL